MAHRRLDPSCPEAGCDGGCADGWHDHVTAPPPGTDRVRVLLAVNALVLALVAAAAVWAVL